MDVNFGFVESVDENKLTFQSAALPEGGTAGVLAIRGPDSVEFPDPISENTRKALIDMKERGFPVVTQVVAAAGGKRKRVHLFSGLRAQIGEVDFVEGDSFATIDLLPSASRYFLPRSHDDFESLLDQLRAAKESKQVLWVAVLDIKTIKELQKDDCSSDFETFYEFVNIIGPYAPPRTVASLPGNRLDEMQHRQIGIEETDTVFEALKQSREIPFDYVQTGCVQRAHEMCRLISQYGIHPFKVWAFPSQSRRTFTVTTNYHPDGFVNWSFHVAAAVKTNDGLRILDPSTRREGIQTVNQWRGVLSKETENLYFTTSNIYVMTVDQNNLISDPHYQKTKEELAMLRNSFQFFIDRFESAPPY